LHISLNDTKSTLTYARVFSILFTILMIIIIIVFVIILHVRFIRRSLSSFQIVIGKVNEGDLDQRVTIKKASELAMLARNFNRMLDNFQRAQQELERYHEKELESAEKLATVGEMAARLAHDVRNPLTGIANSIEIILADMKDSPHMPILQEIRRQTTRVNEAINNLLKYSRSKEINKKPGNINELVNNMVFFLQSQKQNKGISFYLDVDPNIPEFEFDAEQMENVLMNLCYNAIQAMGNNGLINIKTEIEDGGESIMISIQDNGPGIPEDIQTEVFKPFYTTRTEGTGLGLAIARDTVRKHNGKIKFESKAGEGTIFYICLPMNLGEI